MVQERKTFCVNYLTKFFLCVPSCISGVRFFWWDFWSCDFLLWLFFCFFKNPTIEVVTFHLRGWCVLGVFVAGIHPSRTWMLRCFQFAQTKPLFILSSENVLGNGVRTHVNSKRKIPSHKVCNQFGLNSVCCCDLLLKLSSFSICLVQLALKGESPMWAI